MVSIVQNFLCDVNNRNPFGWLFSYQQMLMKYISIYFYTWYFNLSYTDGCIIYYGLWLCDAAAKCSSSFWKIFPLFMVHILKKYLRTLWTDYIPLCLIPESPIAINNLFLINNSFLWCFSLEAESPLIIDVCQLLLFSSHIIIHICTI